MSASNAMAAKKAFISSVYWGLQSVREQLYDWAKASGYEAWVFEKSEPDLGAIEGHILNLK